MNKILIVITSDQLLNLATQIYGYDVAFIVETNEQEITKLFHQPRKSRVKNTKLSTKCNFFPF